MDGLQIIGGRDRPDRVADVIFVHGLDGDARTTWHPKERPDAFWPAWLGEDVPAAGVWSLGYAVSASAWKGHAMPLADRATNVLDRLDLDGIGRRPIVFVCHSLGGLLVKQMLRHASDFGNPAWKAITMQTKKIFLASSSELKEDRKEFEIFINRKNKEWVDKGVFLELIVWEDFLDAVSKTRLQDEYNQAIRQYDVFVMLFFTKVGKYTAEEFETAFRQFQATRKPFIFTYFKDAPISTGSADKDDLMSLFAFKKKLKALGHFVTVYQNFDALKFHFNQQLDKLAATDFIELKTEWLLSGKSRLMLRKRLGSDWQDLADYFDIPSAERAGFEKGREALGVFVWGVTS